MVGDTRLTCPKDRTRNVVFDMKTPEKERQKANMYAPPTQPVSSFDTPRKPMRKKPLKHVWHPWPIGEGAQLFQVQLTPDTALSASPFSSLSPFSLTRYCPGN
jgi:hypothetical protein